jgi:hypothetical protein
MELSVGKIIGRMEEGCWGQVHDFVPEGEEKLLARGRLVAVVGLEQNDNAGQVKMVETGREILARVHELYYVNLTGGAMEALKKAVTVTQEEFGGVELGCVAFVEKTIYVVTAGGVKVWVNLNGREGWVSAGEKGIKTLSGWGVSGEVIVMGNRRFWDNLPMGILKAAVGQMRQDVDAAVEMLAAAEHGNEMGGGEVGVMIQIKEVAEPAAEEEISEEPKDKEVTKEPAATKSVMTWNQRLMNKLGKLKIGEGRVYVDYGEREKKRKKNMYIGLGVVVLMLLFGGVGQWRMKDMAFKNSQSNKLLEELEYQYNEAKALTVLNPVRSRQLLAEVQQRVNDLEANKVKDSRLTAIEAELPEVISTAAGVKKTQAVEVIDLGLVRTGMKGTKIALKEGMLVILDSEGDRVVTVDPIKKSGQVIAGKEGVGEAKLVATYPGKIEILSDKGMVQIVDDQTPKVKIAPDKEWGNIADIKMFAGNIYMLDAGAGKIWRYGVTDGGFGSKQSWVSKDQQVKLTGTNNMAIDGSVWVISEGEITKLLRGVKENFTITGLDKNWGSGAIIYTDENAENLYILDSLNGRIIVLKKDGTYDKQIVADQLGTATDLVTDEKSGKVYVLSGEKVWEVGL